MAVGRVEQIISLRGENNTQKAVADAKAGISSLGEASKTVAERSGDLERGFRGVKDILGNVGGANLAPLIDGLGGVEAVIKGFGPALNPLTIGLAAAGTAAYAIWQNLEKARIAAINANIKELEIAKESTEATAKKLAISNDLLGVGREQQTVESIQNEARTTAGKLLDAQIEKQKAGIENNKEKIRLQDLEIGRLKMQLIDEETRLKLQRQANAEYDAFAATQERARRQTAVEEDRINSIMNFRDRINARSELQQRKLNALRVEEEKIVYRLNLGDANREKQEKRITEIVAERKRIEGEQLADAAAVQAKQKERADKGKQYAADERSAIASLAQARADAAATAGADEQTVYELQIKAIRELEQAEIKAARTSDGTAKAKAAKIEAIQLAARQKEAKLQDEAFTRQAERDKASEEGAKRVADARVSAEETYRKAQIAAATDPAQKLSLVLDDLKIQSTQKLSEIQNNGLLDAETRSIREKALILETANLVKAAEKEKQDAIAKSAEEARKALQKQIDTSADIVGNAASVVAAYQGKDGLGTALVETAKQVKAVSAGWEDNKNKSGALIGAVGSVAAAFVDGEKEKAGVLAIMEAAQAIASFAIGDIPGGVAHTAAAALYGGVAGGIISTSKAPSAGGAGGFSAGATAGSGTGAAAGPVGTTTIVNFNAPLGTQYEIGKSVVKAQKAAFSMGWSPAMAGGI